MSRDEFFQEGQTPIPFDYVDLYMPLLAPLEWQVLSCAMRLTWGEGKHEALITIDQFRELGGISQGGCVQALKKLKEFNLLTETGRNHRGVYYAPQMDSSQVDFAGLQARCETKKHKGQTKTEKARAQRSEQAIRFPVPPLTPEQNGYVYLACAGEHHKIGMSIDPRKRIAKLNAQSPIQVTLKHVIPADNMQEAEELLHSDFASKRVKGEWFALDEDDVAWLCSVEGYDDGTFRANY